jgi:hypothetical protein
VGTTTSDIPASSIQEFQLSQSNMDISQDITSSGAVNVVTKSGTNTYHGEGFGFFRDSSMAAALPTPEGATAPPFQRSQFGGRFGGPIIKDKLFFFLDAERTKQDSVAPVIVSDVLSGQSGTFSQPFRQTSTLGRVDYQLGKARLFYRGTYFQNSLFATFGLGFSVYNNKNITRNHVVGADFTTGSWAHSLRYSFLKFQNQIVDATVGTGLPLADLGVELRIQPTGFISGPNLLAPQSTPQANNEAKYDGIKSVGKHTFRFGGSYNHIQGGGFAKFFSIAPRMTTNLTDQAKLNGVTLSATDFANLGPFPGGSANPLNYPVEDLLIGNGQGFSTEKPALGFPAGGLGPDNRIGLYVGDVWKVFPNFTVTLGLRYDRDTGRTDSDLPAIPELNAVLPGFGNRVNNPNMNFAPQIGIALDPVGNGKTVVRAGVGMFYENVIFNNVLFDRPLRLRTGAFLQTPTACNNGQPQIITAGSGSTVPIPNGVCRAANGDNIPVGVAAPAIAAFQAQYQAANPFDVNAVNPNFIGDIATAGANTTPALFAPNYKSPLSIQMNFGVQHEVRPGMIATADFVRNVTTRTLLGIDVNHTGDARFFNLGNAQAAIDATNATFKQGANGPACPPGSAGIDCAIAAGATIGDYAANGLGSQLDTGGACQCAFGGLNPNLGQMFFLEPIGRSVYNALQMKLSQNIAKPLPGIRALNFQVSYSLSRFSNSGGATLGATADNDQDFVLQAADNNQPNRYFGPSLLDRTHQFSFGGYVDTPGGFRWGLIGHFYSPLSSTLAVADVGTGGGIFQTDFTGDGTTQDPFPGTTMGSFDRHVNAGGLNNFINSYNGSVAGNPTPAGQVLLNNGLFTLAQLQALQGVAPSVGLAPPGQVDLDWLRAFDLRVAWRHTFKERFVVEPSVAFYNVLNFANFNLPPNTLSGVLGSSGFAGALNGTTYNTNNTRIGNGTGVYGVGAPRQIEFGLRFTF